MTPTTRKVIGVLAVIVLFVLGIISFIDPSVNLRYMLGAGLLAAGVACGVLLL